MKKIIYNVKNDTFSILNNDTIITVSKKDPQYKKLKLQTSTIPGLVEINDKEPITKIDIPIASEIPEDQITEPEITYLDENTEILDNEPIVLNCNTNELKAYEWEVRQERNAKIFAVRWIIERHRDQIDNKETPTLSEQDYRSILNYIRSLRNLPQHKGFPWKGLSDPGKIPWPLRPKILIELLQKNKESNTI